MAMPEVDAFFSMHALLKNHCPQYFLPTLPGVHAGCALVDRCLAIIDPPLHRHLSRALGNPPAQALFLHPGSPTATQRGSRSTSAASDTNTTASGGTEERAWDHQSGGGGGGGGGGGVHAQQFQTPHRGAFALPMLMSFFACCRPLNQVLKVWDAMLAFGVHLNVILCVTHLVLLRAVLLAEPHPLQHLTPRRLPSLDAELLVRVSFEIIPHLPKSLLEEVSMHARMAAPA